jgi:hypothetical protein
VILNLDTKSGTDFAEERGDGEEHGKGVYFMLNTGSAFSLTFRTR